ncbi:right-handed parallel beta-helix repeat-containing protein [Sediminibacterium soli]|uniref:right-handed parallel beta-helix repeat-containing protein n=1 Tax=Sediminibacterium soli TaxID=2698829 RepID=UPI00137B58F9|nr:right-handed parallel beta-helix repeat-containing protein [Sediminibacterium soli]NCI47010.1 hypothetical protein [Sediminibacterium soli]
MQRILSCIWLLLFAAGAGTAGAADIRLQPGMVIRQSGRVVQDSYHLNADSSLRTALIEIEGQDIVIDFNNAVLQGSGDRWRPDAFYGLAVRIRKGSKNITVRNARIHGYKIAILADSVQGLVIDHCDLSYNWRQELKSNREREDISDWMSYHKNEQDEWMRYGAALYLRHTNKAVVSNNTVTGGQCALMMTDCGNAEVYDNDFSFNSGIGIGLYRSSGNRIYHNRLDFNVRGYSHGKYQRGQDSAAILVFEQCNNNVFAFNTATHSGDGFFLWAGQTTMDKGTGGCNDNFIYGNDFSFAPTNGIEVTFSRNLIMKNRIRNCDHGIWGGYSFDTDITDNSFENNRIGIAIEHGQGINIALNGFNGDKTGIKLWSREKQPAHWAYARLHNTESRNYWIAANRFTNNPVAIDIMGTDTVVLQGNTKLNVSQNLVVGDRAEDIDTSRDEEMLDIEYQKDERLQTIKATELPAAVLPSGKEQIRITPWGPYDFRYPLLWLKNIDSTGTYHFEVLGAKGSWEIASTKGFSIQRTGEKTFPSGLSAKPDSALVNRSIDLRYTGPGFTDAYGRRHDSGEAHVFSYTEFDPHPQWNIAWYKWDAAYDPAKGYDRFQQVTATEPFTTSVAAKLDYTWWGAVSKGLPADSFATVAATTVFLPGDLYEVAVTADDYVKVFIDGKEVIDAWDAKYTLRDEDTHHRIQLRLPEGDHTIRVIHAEDKGLATLMFYIRPVNDKKKPR